MLPSRFFLVDPFKSYGDVMELSENVWEKDLQGHYWLPLRAPQLPAESDGLCLTFPHVLYIWRMSFWSSWYKTQLQLDESWASHCQSSGLWRPNWVPRRFFALGMGQGDGGKLQAWQWGFGLTKWGFNKTDASWKSQPSPFIESSNKAWFHRICYLT